jgi:uncharacterized protein YkwD
LQHQNTKNYGKNYNKPIKTLNKWDMIFKKTLLIICALVIHFYALGQTTDDYLKQNQIENRLNEYKDSPQMLKLKIEHLEVINKSRLKYNVQPVKLDILASRVANKIAMEAAHGKFMGHFNRKGETPWQRYAFAGGVDHVSENAAAISSTEKIQESDKSILLNMKRLHQAFMDEKAPNDGHKQTCIHPHHNFVGIGVAIHEREFRYYEEYVDRYIEFKNIVTATSPGKEITINVKPIQNNHHIQICLIYHQPFPKSMSARTISAIPSYNDYGKTLVKSLAPWDLPQSDKQGYLSIPFQQKQKGLYYIQIYLHDKPYEKGKISTDGMISASGLVIEVR